MLAARKSTKGQGATLKKHETFVSDERLRKEIATLEEKFLDVQRDKDEQSEDKATEKVERALCTVQSRLQEFDLLKAQINSLLDAVKNEAVILVRKETHRTENKVQMITERLASIEDRIVVETKNNKDCQQSCENMLHIERKKLKKQVKELEKRLDYETKEHTKSICRLRESLNKQQLSIDHLHKGVLKLEEKVQFLDQRNQLFFEEERNRAECCCYKYRLQKDATKQAQLEQFETEMHAIRRKLQRNGDVLQSLCHKVLYGFEDVEDRMRSIERQRY